jgi:hypothetical protein
LKSFLNTVVMMIFQRNLTPLEYLYSALWMCCVCGYPFYLLSQG